MSNERVSGSKVGVRYWRVIKVLCLPGIIISILHIKFKVMP